MELTIDMGTSQQWQLKHAFLVYTATQSNGYRPSQEVAFVTHNPVRHLGDDQEIGPGKPVSLDTLMQILQHNEEAPVFMDDKVLYKSRSVVMWWVPPHKRSIFFTPGARHNINGPVENTPHPGLVFRLAMRDEDNPLSIAAVKGGNRPTPETQLFYAPYFNIWKSGRVCHGNAPTPDKDATPHCMREWENSFFSSAFSHPNHTGVIKGDIAEFWRQRQGKKLHKFPESVLASFKMDLDTWTKEAPSNGY
ncbi:PRTRC system protein B [Acidithiobacillus ferriphilus]|uniref:PRTRC system protein B n=1 Tax=Acidithiobacillus ferriphilus TaxID=1689834 RepID=UPI002DB57792|nr:PRTRC system protein B [Acidithiobacillus ferriphilus]MEB8475573.1 PRTRC system protein B [Acidithiobacillus ferriphilus]